MSKSLVTSILFDRSLALEWEESSLTNSHDSLRLEHLLVEASETARQGPGKWLIVLGLSEPAIPLSPSLDFWREFAGRWIHQARTMPEIEEKRGKLTIELPDAEASAFLQRMPAMVGVDRADVAFVQGIWDSIHSAFVGDIRDFKGSVEDYFQKTAPRPRHMDRIHFHLVVVLEADIRTGFDFEALKRADYRSASPA